MATLLNIESIIDIPKMQNECSRMEFLLKRIMRDTEELDELGIEVKSEVQANEKIFQNVLK